MKSLKITAIALLASASTIFAQENDMDYNPEISNMWTLKDVTKTEVETENNDTYIVKQMEITEVFTPVMLDPADEFKLNQDIIFMPTQITKTIKLDYDRDSYYEQEVKFSYEKPQNFDLDFTMTENGIIILTDKDNLYVSKMWDKNSKKYFSNVKMNRIKKEGSYTIKLSNNESVDIEISNYDM